MTQLNEIIRRAQNLQFNDQTRFDLAAKIEELPGVPAPTKGGKEAHPSTILTPMIACLDPMERFPVINAREGVRNLLHAYKLSNVDLVGQVKGMVGLIGQLGISDSFMIDVLAEFIAKDGPKEVKTLVSTKPSKTDIIESELPIFDEAERKAVKNSSTVTYRNRHNKITNLFKSIFETYEILRGTSHNCKYDMLMKNYDGNGRDLLIEAKPEADKGSIRIAIGQLFDYRRFLSSRVGTDLALLTINSPTKIYIELLHDLQITCLWFENENSRNLKGSGKAYEPLSNLSIIRASHAASTAKKF